MRGFRRGRVAVLGVVAFAAAGAPREAAGDDGKVSAVKVWTAQADYKGPCPVRIPIEGQVTTTGAVPGLTVQFQHSDGTKSKVIPIPAKVAGTYPVKEVIDRRSGSWNHTIVLAVLTPTPASSAAITLKGVCVDTQVVPPVGPPNKGKGPELPKPGTLSPGPGDEDPRTGLILHPIYRVTALGFEVARQTIESGLETNGVGDEVKLLSVGCEYRADSPQPRPLGVVSSFLHGSLDRGFHGELAHGFRVRAGSGNGLSQGGLVTGDSVGAGLTPPAGAGPDLQRTHMFPLVLWQGALRDGPTANLVVLAPMLWELDRSGQPMPAFDAQIAQSFATDGDRYLRESHHPAFRGLILGDVEFRGSVMPGEFDRPIGVSWEGPHSPIQAEQAVVLFRPWTLRLNRTTASQLSSTNGGRMDLPFTDSAEFGGSYMLHLRIELVR